MNSGRACSSVWYSAVGEVDCRLHSKEHIAKKKKKTNRLKNIRVHLIVGEIKPHLSMENKSLNYEAVLKFVELRNVAVVVSTRPTDLSSIGHNPKFTEP